MEVPLQTTGTELGTVQQQYPGLHSIHPVLLEYGSSTPASLNQAQTSFKPC